MLHPSLNACGGAEKICLAFLHSLIKNGFEVTLVTIDKTDWHLLREVFGDPSIKSVDEQYLFVKMPRMFTATMRGFFTVLFYFFETIRVWLKGSFDLVVNTSGELVDSSGDLVYINALPLRLLHHYPGVYVEQGVQWRTYSKLYDLFLKALPRLQNQRILCTNSRFNREIIQKHLDRTPLVLYPPVDIQKFRSPIQARKDLVVTVSRFRPGKILETVPKIAGLVNSRFLIIGPSNRISETTITELKRTIERVGVKDRVELLVNKENETLVRALSSAKVFLHTQPYEAFGLAVVEAMAAGCVPVVPRCGGPWFDILDRKEGKYGFSYGSGEEAAQKIARLLKDERLRLNVSARTVERAKTFDVDHFEAKINYIIKKFNPR